MGIKSRRRLVRNRRNNIPRHPRNITGYRTLGYRLGKVQGNAYLGNMSASTAIGRRPKQEDSELLMKHPKNGEFKLMAIADGVGEGGLGDIASSDVLTGIKEWFSNLDVTCYNDTGRLANEAEQALIKISREMNDKYFTEHPDKFLGSTAVVAIVGKDNAVILHVGDSRGYIITQEGLSQVTEDHSYVYDLFRDEKLKDTKGNNILIDDLRFHKSSSGIKQCMGYKYVKPDVYLTKKNSLLAIILVSDGVSDYLSDKDLIAITETTDRRALAKMLVAKALSNNSKRRPNLGDANYRRKMTGGGDNTTALVCEFTR